MQVNCLNCGKEFKTVPAKIADGRGKFCSKECHYEYVRNNTKKIFIKCLNCNEYFELKYNRGLKDKRKFCSHKCHGEYSSQKITMVCLICGKNFKLKPYAVKRGRGKYCSKECSSKGQIGRPSANKGITGKESHSYKGGIEISKERRNNILRDRRKTSAKYRINSVMSGGIFKSLKGSKAGRSWTTFVPYTEEQLETHLRTTIPDGYTWQDFMNGKLHIDHIIPVSAFNYTKPEHIDFQRCWSLKNLQLLTAYDNISKGAKLTQDFQTALAI